MLRTNSESAASSSSHSHSSVRESRAPHLLDCAAQLRARRRQPAIPLCSPNRPSFLPRRWSTTRSRRALRDGLRCGCCARRMVDPASRAGSEALRGDFLSAHVELGYGRRSARQMGDRPAHPLCRQGHAVPLAASTAARRGVAFPSIAASQPDSSPRSSASSRGASTSFSRWRPKEPAAIGITGSPASIGSRVRRRCRSRSHSSIIHRARSV